MAELGPRLGTVNRRVPALNVRISLHHTGPKGCGDPSQGHASGREGIGVSGSAVLLGECRGSVRRTSSSGSTLEAHRSKRCDHCLDEGAVAKEEKADGEDELGEKTQNFRGGHWSEAKAQGNVSKILV